MTTEEKAKAYDEALERARKVHSEIVNNELLGFPGQIEDIFPELKESEDEKIIKEIVGVIQKHYPNTPESYRWIAWLEKQKGNQYFVGYVKGYSEGQLNPRQKEQKHPNGCFTCDEYNKGYEAGRLNGLTAGYNKAMKEQKPEYPLTPDECIKPTWSEEDEKIRQSIIKDIEFDRNYTSAETGKVIGKYYEQINWLKSLRPQPKAEWNEEDKAMIKSILFVLESYVSKSESASSPSLITTYPTYYKEIDWLKSLRPTTKK